MRSLIALYIGFAAMLAAPVHAQVLSAETYMEQWDPAAQQWVRVSGDDAPKAERFLSAHTKPKAKAIASYGPFRVHDRHSSPQCCAIFQGSPRCKWSNVPAPTMTAPT